MITLIKISDNNRAPFNYMSNVEAFRNGAEFIFKPGVNVIIGKNGSGKSTLLNLISKYTLCEKTMCSEVPSAALSFPDIFDESKVFDGVSIHADYIGKVFRLLPHTEMDKEDILKNIHNFSSYMSGSDCSSGEKGVCAVNALFKIMFSQADYAFPIAKLKEYGENVNTLWKNRIGSLIGYYKKNHVKVLESDFEYTILMDEPDRNLDIENIMQIYGVLSFHKPQTQIIAIIHNPALIYKLSKLDCVHFVEMTEGYLEEVINFINK